MENKINIQSKKRVISNKQLIEKSELDDVIYFLQGYARKDPKFNILLKTHFINVCETDEILPLLTQVLHAVIKPRSTSEEHLSRSQYNLFLQAAATLLIQLTDKIASEQYVAAFRIIYPVLEKICYVRAVYHTEAKLEQLSVDFHQSITTLLLKDIAPALRFEILTYLTTLTDRSYYNFPMDYNVIDIILYGDIKDSEFLSSLEHNILLKHQNCININDYENSIGNIVSYLRIIHFNDSSINDISKDYLANDLLEAYGQMLDKQFYDSILYSIHAVTCSGRTEQKINDLIIKVHGINKHKSELQTRLIASFLRYKDFKYFDNLKSSSTGAQWKKHTKLFRKSLFADGNIHHIALYLKKEDHIEELITVIKRFGDWELIKDFSHYLFEKNKHKLEQIYTNYTHQIVSNNPPSKIDNKLLDVYRFISTNNDEHMLKSVKQFTASIKPNKENQ